MVVKPPDTTLRRAYFRIIIHYNEANLYIIFFTFRQLARLTKLATNTYRCKNFASGAGVTYPGVTYPGVTYPGVTYPGVTYPGVTYPGVTYPGVTYPGVTDPGVTDPGVTEPHPLWGSIPTPSIAVPFREGRWGGTGYTG
jgi:hypothetical protein